MLTLFNLDGNTRYGDLIDGVERPSRATHGTTGSAHLNVTQLSVLEELASLSSGMSKTSNDTVTRVLNDFKKVSSNFFACAGFITRDT